MRFAPHSIVPSHDDTAQTLAAPWNAKVATRKPSPPKKGPAAAWEAWTADGSPSAGIVFVESVSSWVQGTAAQLLRARWPTGVERPTASEVEERLCHHLGVAAGRPLATYLEALEWARRAVIEEAA
jgi:hypothetical protein